MGYLVTPLSIRHPVETSKLLEPILGQFSKLFSGAKCSLPDDQEDRFCFLFGRTLPSWWGVGSQEHMIRNLLVTLGIQPVKLL